MVVAVHDPRSVGIPPTSTGWARRSARSASPTGCRGATRRGRSFPSRQFDPLGGPARGPPPWPFLATVHDVVPRTRALRPLHRAVVAPCAPPAGRVVDPFPARRRDARPPGRCRPSRVEIIPFPAGARSVNAHAALSGSGSTRTAHRCSSSPACSKTQSSCARTLGGRAVDFLRPCATGLAGRVGDQSLAREAEAIGARVLPNPGPKAYEEAIVAADAVICVRAATVGESNGPLLDAIGAGRPSLVSTVGSGLVWPALVHGSSTPRLGPSAPGWRRCSTWANARPGRPTPAGEPPG